ncbi:hypothetical protein Lalb_Chr10g0092831 [Lupinus albus]|uniref:Uncharacterized protein n=1 Tax=Lupinus albus TaxID=3870 RepID=A0A6A4PU75_LUPAL|nr:hypothetical protein Lalb_Chr10g0092831 [Lupinus albus]
MIKMNEKFSRVENRVVTQVKLHTTKAGQTPYHEGRSNSTPRRQVKLHTTKASQIPYHEGRSNSIP